MAPLGSSENSDSGTETPSPEKKVKIEFELRDDKILDAPGVFLYLKEEFRFFVAHLPFKQPIYPPPPPSLIIPDDIDVISLYVVWYQTDGTGLQGYTGAWIQSDNYSQTSLWQPFGHRIYPSTDGREFFTEL